MSALAEGTLAAKSACACSAFAGVLGKRAVMRTLAASTSRAEPGGGETKPASTARAPRICERSELCFHTKKEEKRRKKRRKNLLC